MKIVFFTRLFYPHIGGVEKHVYEVGRRLIDQGHEVIIITEKISNKENILLDADTRKNLEKFKVYHIPVKRDNWFKKFAIWKWLWEHRELLFSANIIHCHDVFFWYLPFAIINPMKPVYTTFHGYETVFPPRKRAIFIRKVSEYMSNKSIIVGDFIKKWYGTTPELVTYGGVDLPTTNAKESNSKSRLKILFVGRIEEDTGVFIYNEVLQILSNTGISFEFKAVGDGSQRKVFKQWGEVTGFVTNIKEHIRKSDIVFVSSYLSILETFVQKKPVVAVYQNTLKKDYLLMTPFRKWIIASDDPMEISHSIIKFVKDRSTFTSKVDSAYGWASYQSWEKLTEEYLNVWKQSK